MWQLAVAPWAVAVVVLYAGAASPSGAPPAGRTGSLGASSAVEPSSAAQSSSVTVYHSWGSDKTFRLEAKSHVVGTISLKPNALNIDGATLAAAWQCAYVFDYGFSDDQACTQSGATAVNSIQGSGTVAVTGAFGTAGNNASGTFSFSCRQLSSKGCSGSVDLKFPKLAQ